MQVKGQIVTDCHTLPPALKLKVDLWDLGASHAVIDAGHGAGRRWGGCASICHSPLDLGDKSIFPFCYVSSKDCKLCREQNPSPARFHLPSFGQ